MDVAEVVVETDGHDSYVDGENCAAATPDLLANVEAGLLEHMVSEHADEVATLTSLIPTALQCASLLSAGAAATDARPARPLPADG